jgi:methyl-accepting chemotaxis protein
MFTSIRSRILAASAATVVFALIADTTLNYYIANAYSEDTTSRNLSAMMDGHQTGISDWVSSKTHMIVSLEDAAIQADPTTALKQVAAAGTFTSVYVGYPNKTAKFSDPTGVPASYDPTVRPWYRQAVAAGAPVVTPPYVDMGSGKLVVTFAAPILRDGILKGVVAGDVAMDSVIGSIKAIRPTSASFGMLVDGNGRIVAVADPKMTLKPVTDLMADLKFPDLASSSTNTHADPVEAHVGNSAKLLRAGGVAGTDWMIVIALDKSDAAAGTRSQLHASLAAMVLLAAVSALIVGMVTTGALKRLSRVRDAMNSIGSGTADLTKRLPADGHDEVSQIARSFNGFIGSLNGVISQIRGASETVRLSANEIAASNLDLSARTESAAASLQETAASVEQISATVLQSAHAADNANDSVKSTSNIALQGAQVVREAFSTIQLIEAASDEIGEITGVIDGIAFQTNILALNAAVEAARAGEHGRGFAVVAGEVRNLAQRSALAAKEIKTLIKSTIDSVIKGSSQVRQAGEAISQIVNSVSNVTTIMEEITNATHEQTRGIDEINRAITQLDQIVQRNATLVEESAAATTALETQATQLADAVARFKLS